MERKINKRFKKEYDLIIIGAGIYGICAAWDAALRGLSVAILDKRDFCCEASANCLKIIHGGFRYIQHADITRIRHSVRERRILMQIAPHLIKPMPFLIPTYGHGIKGKEILATALFLYDLISFDRNRGAVHKEKQIPYGKIISKSECLRLFPILERKNLTGGVIFHDGQMYNPARLAISFLRSAIQRGTDAFNYMEATDFIINNDQVIGIKTKDMISGKEYSVRGKVIMNAGGPWSQKILNKLGLALNYPLTFTKDYYLVVTRKLSHKYALAMPSEHKDDESIMSRGGRHFFIIPWRNHSLIGSSHLLYNGDPDEYQVTNEELKGLLREVNTAYSNLSIAWKEVAFWNSGLVPHGDYYGKRSRIIDHAKDHNIEGLISVIGMRFTTARGVACEAIDLVCKKLFQNRIPQSKTNTTPIFGGCISNLAEFMLSASDHRPPELSIESMNALLNNYGSKFKNVLKYIDSYPETAKSIGNSTVIKAEVIHAVREEKARKLEDVVFRRTDLGTAGNPGEPAIQECAKIMADELNWDQSQLQKEMDEVRRYFH